MLLPLCLSSPSPVATQAASVALAPLPGLPAWTWVRLQKVTQLEEGLPPPQRPDGYWLQADTLRFLARQEQGFSTEALLLRHADGRRVTLTLQTFTFSASGNVRAEARGERSSYDLRRRLLSPFTWRVAAIGQFLTSGPYACDGLRALAAGEQAQLLAAVAEALCRRDRRLSAVVIKDICTADSPVCAGLRQQAYYALPVDPVMELALDPTWKDLDDYLAAVTSKYRVRYRRARAKLAGLRRAELPLDVLDRCAERMYDLYQETRTGADYNAASLSRDYFMNLARRQVQATGRTGITGYWDGETLVGFTTLIHNGPVAHAHYLGMQNSYKQSHHLYHNMLFDLLGAAIERRAAVLDYGRTALEIKSSLGAVPVDYCCLIRARNPLLNRLIPVFTPAVYSPNNWQPRSPFKQQAS